MVFAPVVFVPVVLLAVAFVPVVFVPVVFVPVVFLPAVFLPVVFVPLTGPRRPRAGAGAGAGGQGAELQLMHAWVVADGAGLGFCWDRGTVDRRRGLVEGVNPPVGTDRRWIYIYAQSVRGRGSWVVVQLSRPPSRSKVAARTQRSDDHWPVT